MMGGGEKNDRECCQWSAAWRATLMDQSVYTCLTASEGGPGAKTAIKALSEQPHLHVKMGAQISLPSLKI